jgi:ATP-binding cassette subfamily B protein
VHQTLTGVSVVQAFAREDDEQRRFQELASEAIRAHQRNALVGSVYGLGSGLLTTVGTAAVMWTAAMRVLDGRLTVGTTLVFLSYLASLQWQLSVFTTMYSTLQTAGASIDRVMQVFDDDDAVPERLQARALPHAAGDVVLENVVFGYRPEQPVLRGVSITAAAGDVVAIVGETGAGKSTLVGLIPRFFDAESGRVLIDGHDIRDLQVRSLRKQIAVVLQEPFLFPMSLAANIAFGRPTATREEIERAARIANAHDFIAALPDGYDTVIGQRGATLSGGEPADFDRPGRAQGRADPDSRRADQRARRRDRTGPGRGVGAPDARPDHVHHRPPALDDSKSHEDRRARAWSSGGGRQSRPADAGRWTLRRAALPAVRASGGIGGMSGDAAVHRPRVMTHDR